MPPFASAGVLALIACAVLVPVGVVVGVGMGRTVPLFRPHDPDPGTGADSALDDDGDAGPPPPECPHCAAEIPFLRALPVPAVRGFLLQGKCPACGRRVRASAVAVAATAVLFGLSGYAFATGPQAPPVWLAALLLFTAVGVALSVVDARVKRLPNVLVLRSYPVVAVLVAAAALTAGPDWKSLGDAIVGAAGLYAFYFLLWFIYPAGMGWGDVKLSGLLGLMLGWQSLGSVVSATLLAFVGSGLIGVALMVARLATRKTEIPLGPFMIGAAIAVLLFGDPLAALAAA